MGFTGLLALFSALCFALPALAQNENSSPTSCPLQPDQLREMSDDRIGTLCARSARARAAAESRPNSYGQLRICKNSLRMARESGRVIQAVSMRRSTFNPTVPDTLNQSESYDAAARLHLAFHNYTNISVAAIYRSRLKLRKFAGHAEEKDDWVKRDVDALRREAEMAGARNPNPRMNPALERSQGNHEALAGLLFDIRLARLCMESMKKPLDAAFDTWIDVKADLLKTKFTQFVPEGQGNAEVEAHVQHDAEALQKEQQYVHDVLTDPTKRDWAYKLAEGCQQSRCDVWSTPLGIAEWSAKASGFVSKTPVLATVVRVISGGLAGDLAMRQGLSFWQQIREMLNGITPFGLDLIDTEVKAIERGEVRPYKAP